MPIESNGIIKPDVITPNQDGKTIDGDYNVVEPSQLNKYIIQYVIKKTRIPIGFETATPELVILENNHYGFRYYYVQDDVSIPAETDNTQGASTITIDVDADPNRIIEDNVQPEYSDYYYYYVITTFENISNNNRVEYISRFRSTESDLNENNLPQESNSYNITIKLNGYKISPSDNSIDYSYKPFENDDLTPIDLNTDTKSNKKIYEIVINYNDEGELFEISTIIYNRTIINGGWSNNNDVKMEEFLVKTILCDEIELPEDKTASEIDINDILDKVVGLTPDGNNKFIKNDIQGITPAIKLKGLDELIYLIPESEKTNFSIKSQFKVFKNRSSYPEEIFKVEDKNYYFKISIPNTYESSETFQSEKYDIQASEDIHVKGFIDYNNNYYFQDDNGNALNAKKTYLVTKDDSNNVSIKPVNVGIQVEKAGEYYFPVVIPEILTEGKRIDSPWKQRLDYIGTLIWNYLPYYEYKLPN